MNQFLKQICIECKKANGHCIKNDDYIGLCAENDKQELIEYYESVSVNRKNRK